MGGGSLDAAGPMEGDGGARWTWRWYSGAVMHALTAKVRNGRLVLDEPTDLPEGAEVPLQVIDPDDLTDEERTALHASLERGLADVEAGRVVDHSRIKEVLRATRARP